MSQQQKFHLFNCDHIYDLDVIADLINATEAKLGFDFTVEKHYFSLPQMSELSEKIIPELQMDFAVFVAHAHESRLSINEDDRGYTKVYRALLQATGGKVIIVIGGDDNFKNEDEEERFVLSRWARRMVSSQLKGEFLDGRQGFIFSWNEKHRKIHEEALLHFFDPNKKGKKFQYQPSPALPSELGKTAGDENVQPASSNKETQQKDQSKGDDVTKPGDEEISSGSNEDSTQQVQDAVTQNDQEPIMFKSIVRNGKISYEKEDVTISRPGFEVPDYIAQSLLENQGDTSEAVVKIVSDPNDESVLRWSVTRRLHQTLMLKTRVRHGVVSFDEEDVEFVRPAWEIPPYITATLKRQASNGKLSVFSDEEGNFRFKVVTEEGNWKKRGAFSTLFKHI